MTTPPGKAEEKSTSPPPAEPARRKWRIDWIVLVVGLAVTVAATLYVKQSIERAKEVEFSSQCNRVKDEIVGRLYDHARVLRSGAAFFNASNMITREEWRIYNRLQKLEQQLPGIQGIGFSLLIPRKDLAGHIQEIRSEGFPEYKIKPEGDRESYTSIVYLEPFDWRNQRAFGYDMFSEAVRREAMERARDMDRAALSGKVLLVQETDKEVQAGNLMYVPVYRKNMPTETKEQRRAAIYGWVYSPYRMNDLINGISSVRDLLERKQIHLQVFDGISSSPQSLLYESPPSENQIAWTDDHFTRQLLAEFNGHTWTLLFRQTGVGFTTSGYMGVWITLVGCTIITLLLFVLTRNLLHIRANALQLEQRTVDLQAERQRLARILEGTRAGTWEWNVQTGEIIFNEQWAGIIGYSLAELSPISIETWRKYVHPDDLQKSDTLLEKHFCRDSGCYDFETRMMHKDGHWIWALVRGKVASWSDDGKPLWMFGTHQDITERKQAEEEKIKLEGQLYQAQKIESIGQLAGGVAHDFNNMLGVILGHAEMALMKADSSNPFISDLQEISNAAKHSATLTRQLLTFARKQVIAPKVLDLNEAVGGILKMLQRLIGENIQLSWNPAANLWPVKIDPSQLDQILANLCVNARDAIDGIGKITIMTTNITWDESTIASRPYYTVAGDYVQLSVSDDGCGMDKEVQSHIFEPFYTTKELGSGTGLGLATVYGAVKQNHGFITVYSEEGMGTVFNIYLPREKATVEVITESTAKTLRSGTETILLVEDDKMLLDMVTSMLEESGYTVLAAATTELAQALAKEHSGPIHLLISDVIMPVMNGKELSEKLMPFQPDMKVLFLSGYTADIISNQGVIEDKTNFLQKPFSVEALTAKVREVLDGH